MTRGARTLLLVALLACAPAHGAAQAVARIAIVVGDESPIAEVTRDELRELYLKRRRMWPGGQPALPLNLPADDPVRAAFSRHVLGRLPEQLVTYWDRQYFDGITPPAVLRSSAAVCEYVAAEPDAIGYVELPDVTPRCRVLLVLEP